ncbi:MULTISPECIES: ATP-binding protein [unclassified Arthrobacter]|uniref:ATP-binding protein n=1 Tax=unclassified Arthrobacter TaxID=235627 RepID=UPI001E2BE417|nr:MULTISPECIES: ATP-binding protein [unclassified Arthrobacter]MCC9146852.1 ATP-binding protein [Arthrobacter sp. zg-Y919]MDK1278083.1 ATP-binding protein [Arthrobacter sp. zg.Y919]WIB03329.1 ATP-binding protein [Arthrobacter sp. zg-Y919]
MSIETTLPMGDLINPGQNRLASVQIVNWGTFDGAHTISVDRAGTLLTGDSGVGKSTVFDAMLQVMDARPRMNEAAQNNAGTNAEEKRNAFSYMRGRLGTQGTDDGAGTAYQRPGASWSAVCLTFDNGLGQITSLSVVMDLPASGTEHNLGRYYLVHNRPLDIDALQAGMRGRFTKGSLESLLPGASVFDSHKMFAERYRHALGVEDEKAFNLLRILQTGKGLGGTVNDFFRNNVLDTPRTLAAAEEAVEDFSHLRSIRRQLERARQQRDHLQNVPELHTRYRAAADALAHNRALAKEGLPAYRQRLALEGAQRTAEKLESAAAEARSALSAAETRRATLKDQRDALSTRYTEEGGGAIATLERELAAAAAQLRSRETVENAAKDELAAAGIDVDFSPAGLVTARSRATDLVKSLGTELDAARERSSNAHGEAWSLKGQIAKLENEIGSFRRRKSNIRQDSLDQRTRICAATGIDEADMPFAGELIDLPNEHAQWRPAAERTLRSLATALLVPGEHMTAVTRYLSENDMHGYVRCIDVSVPVDGPTEPGPDDLITKLITQDSDMGRWVARKITAHYDFVCVEDPAGLADVAKGVSLGGAVKRNRSTTEKDDRHTKASDNVLGFDNKDTVAALGNELLALRNVFEEADTLSRQHAQEQDELVRRLSAVRTIAADRRTWEELSADDARAAVAVANDRLESARDANADLEQIRFELDTAELDLTAATEKVGVLKGDAARLDADLAAAVERRTALSAKAPEALSEGLRSALAELFEPFGELTDPARLKEAAGEVERSLITEQGRLEKTLLETRAKLERTFETFSDKWGSDFGTSVESAGAYEDRFEDIISEGLPQREAEFREYFNNRTYERFSDLLQLLDEERRSISSRLLPLNSVLRRVEYSAGSHLEIDVATTVPDAAHKFRTELKNALPMMGSRQDKADMDARYAALESLVDRLKDPDEKRWRAEVLDVRSHVTITCTHRLASGHTFTNLQASLMSGGEGQRFTAFIMASALAYQLGIVSQGFSTYGTVMMDEAFVKSSLSFAEASINALHEFGFQLLLAAPEDKVDLSRFLGSVTEILRDDVTNRSGVMERAMGNSRSVDILLR